MGLRMFLNGKQGTLVPWFIGTRQVIRVLFTDDDGAPEDTDAATSLELLVYSDSNRTTLVTTITLAADTAKKGHATYTLTSAFATLAINTTYYLWGKIERTAGDVSISKVSSTLSVS